MSAIDRTSRFLEEFRPELEAWLVPQNPKILLASQAFSADDHDDLVYHWLRLRVNGEEFEVRVDSSGVFYDPEEPRADMVERISERFGLLEEDVVARLERMEEW